jgi:hypothetical protein
MQRRGFIKNLLPFGSIGVGIGLDRSKEIALIG